MNLLEAIQNCEEKEHITVIRITTSFWHDSKGAYMKKSLVFLKRKSRGHNMLLEDCQNMGSEVISRIINFNAAVDGIYEVVACNVSTDYETGMIDDWDLKLIPFRESVTPEQVTKERK